MLLSYCHWFDQFKCVKKSSKALCSPQIRRFAAAVRPADDDSGDLFVGKTLGASTFKRVHHDQCEFGTGTVRSHGSYLNTRASTRTSFSLGSRPSSQQASRHKPSDFSGDFGGLLLVQAQMLAESPHILSAPSPKSPCAQRDPCFFRPARGLLDAAAQALCTAEIDQSKAWSRGRAL